MKNLKKIIVVFFLFFMTIPALSEARHNASVVFFKPTTDGGRYITLYQTENLRKFQYNVGLMNDYAYRPLEYVNNNGNRLRGIVDNVILTNIFGAVGFTDWFEAGINLPISWWEAFYTLNSGATAVPKENRGVQLGDLRLETKFSLPKIKNFPLGFAIIPFMYFPTGDSAHLIGNDMWSPGVKLAIAGTIKDRVWLVANIGYRNYERTAYDSNYSHAVLDDTLELGGGVHVKITKSWAAIGEVYSEGVLSGFFENNLQNPTEVALSGRFMPQKGKLNGLSTTFGGGTALVMGFGSPDFRLFAGIQYTRPQKIKKELAVLKSDRIEITESIHFEFDKAIIKEDSYPILDAVARVITNNPQIALIGVEGHTDWIGSDAYNEKLSDKRANAVRDYLIKKGIAEERLVAKGFGESRPIADNNTTQGRALNRRTDFIIIKY